jgi:L-2-hydroxyglutarate oxidase
MSKKPLDHKYNTIVYPIPLKGAYTLGVHSTMTPDGFMKVGPTTSPAFSLESYQGLENFNFGDLKKIINSYRLILMGQQRGLIWEYLTRDLPKHSISVLIKDIGRIHHMDKSEFESHFYARPGIRAQLIDIHKKFLINDFLLRPQNILEHQGNEFDVIHCLNISSPGWTSAFPFANKILSELLKINEDELLKSDKI